MHQPLPAHARLHLGSTTNKRRVHVYTHVCVRAAHSFQLHPHLQAKRYVHAATRACPRLPPTPAVSPLVLLAPTLHCALLLLLLLLLELLRLQPLPAGGPCLPLTGRHG